jgi:hypothetical protein
MLLSHGASVLQISQNHGRQSFALLRSLKAFASAKFAMPFPALVACIVLADFGRSWFADGGSKNLSL